MRRLLVHPQYKLLSLLIAVTLWMWVQSNEETTATVRVELNWSQPVDKMTVDPLPRYASVSVSGSRTAARRARESKAVSMDLSLTDFQLGNHSLELRGFELQGMPNGVVTQGFTPASIAFRLDEVSTRKVRVRAVQVGEPAAGFIVSELLIEPAVVEVRGPRTRVERLVELSTRPIDVSGFTGLNDAAVRLDLPRAISLVDDVQPRAVVRVEPTVESRTLSGVPVQIWRATGWVSEVASVAVTLEGPPAALAKIGPQDVVAFVHIPDQPIRPMYDAPFGLDEGPRMRVMVNSAPDVRVIRVTPNSLEVKRQ
jgi:YbbR domain-containing protein